MSELVKVELYRDSYMVSSLIIAEQLNKRHDHVVNKIKSVLTPPEYRERKYSYGNNNRATEYLLNKDSFVLLVMNYEGFNDFKRAYIKRFNELEAQSKIALPSYAETLRLYAGEIEKNEALQLEAKENAPKVEFYESVTGSKDTIDLGQVAKVLNIKGYGRNNLFEFLRNKNVLMNNNQPYQKYIDRGYFRLVESKYTKPNGSTHINIKTVVYQKGVDYIRKQVAKES